jgi:hypothetical protein
MTVMNTTTGNGTVRKSLAAEINRLEQTIGTLSQDLRETVREATGTAVEEAIKGLMAEVLTNPDVASLLGLTQNTPTPSAPARQPGMLSRTWSWIASLPSKVRSAWNLARNGTKAVLTGVGAALAAIVVCKAGTLLPAAWLGGSIAALVSRAALALRPGC